MGLQAQGLIHSSLTHTLGLSGATALSPQSHTGRSLSRQGRGCACPDSQAPALTTDAVVGDTRGFGVFLAGAEGCSKLRSSPFQSAQVPPEMGREISFKWGCCVSAGVTLAAPWSNPKAP